MLGTRDAYGKTLARLGEEHPEIVVFDADLSKSTRSAEFGKRFPDRFFNMGLAEQNMLATAAGMAAYGKMPFVSTFAIFASGRAWEQIRQSICYSDLNVKIVATHGGVTVGADGGSHQCTEDVALMRVLPKMTVIVPADAYETEQVIEAVVEHRGPTYIRLARSKFPVCYGPDCSFKIGRAHRIREGRDVSIIAVGLMVHEAMEARDLLAADGIDARVVNMSTIKPIDEEEVLAAARETGGIVTAEEHSVIGGLGSAVAEIVCEKHPVPVKRIGVQDLFGMSGDPDSLLEFYGLKARDIAEAAKVVLDESARA